MREPISTLQLRTCHVILALTWIARGVMAGEPAVFAPPKPHPVSRYERGWRSNPFTVKTTPAEVPNASFAENLVIASVYGNLADPTVVLANVKTNERIRLRRSQTAVNGLKLEQVHVGSGRRNDMRAKVSLGVETAEVYFGTDYLRQVAAVESTKATQAVLQKRQQSLSQHSGSTMRAIGTQQQQHQQAMSGGSVAPNGVAASSTRQDAWLVAGASHSSAAAIPGSSQTGATHNDSHVSTPSLAEDLSGVAHISLRRYNFRSGDEIPVPNPDPQ
ncbi:hypothetical protein [Prosthecobacter sp.]|uniref:hypothetical protein n=1 Tax=Prosthecobacter sp. TaxID=1965333 RepID=UPI003784692A